jgi:hypothetical protein
MKVRDRYGGVVTIIVVIMLIIATRAVHQEVGFWADFVSNLKATLIGAIIGIPLGLWASVLVQERAARSEARAILGHLEAELRLNYETAQELARRAREERQDHPAAMVAFTELRDGFWRATRDAGKLALVTDDALVGALVEAYTSVAILTLLAHSLFQGSPLVALPGGRPGFNPQFDARWWDEVVRAEPAIDAALQAVTDHLRKNKG